jgi:outer membrane receptor protein involved in Fe transport
VAGTLALALLPGQALAATATEIVVTGSRIPQTNLTSAFPMSTTNAAAIEKTANQNLEDVLQRVAGPDMVGGISINNNNGGVGFSLIGLRGLGPQRTLVLVDGQRLVPVFIGSSSIPDFSAIPAGMVDRIEVLRDGASSVYGADAIGGVINIITKRDMEGLTIGGGAGETGHIDAKTWNMNITAGFTSEKGNITVAYLHDKTDALPGNNRDWAIDPHIGGGAGVEGPSAFRSQLDVLQSLGPRIGYTGGLAYAVTGASGLALAATAPCLQFLPGVGATGTTKLNANCELHWNDLTSSVGRDQLAFNTRYELGSNLTFITQAFFTNRTSGQALRPEPLLDTLITSTSDAGTTVFPGFFIPASWPGNGPLSATQARAAGPGPGTTFAADLIPIQWGPRTYRQASRTYRVRAGFEGTVWADYDWEFGYVRQNNDFNSQIHNSGNWNHLGQMTGQVACVNAPGGCSPASAQDILAGITFSVATVPIDFFNPDATHIFNQAQLDYLRYTPQDHNYSDENFWYFDTTGPLFDLPAGKVMGAVGYEYRTEFTRDTPDPSNIEGWGPGPTHPTHGGFNVHAFYGEVRVPVLANMWWAQSLNLTGSYRYDRYNTFGSAKTYKLGFDFQTIPDVRLRGSYSTGFRAPNLAELFGGSAISYVQSVGDPCDSRGLGFNGNANAGTGDLTPGSTCFIAFAGGPFTPTLNLVTSPQIPTLVGGNAALQPELSRQYSLGTIITPHMVPGLTFVADYWWNQVRSVISIGGLGAALGGNDPLLFGCYAPLASGGQNAAFCALVNRNPVTHEIVTISGTNGNFGVNLARGLDLELSYDTELADYELPIPGSFVADLQIQTQFTNVLTALGASTEGVGVFVLGAAGAINEWKGVLNVDYNWDAFSVHWDSRYLSSLQNLFGGPSTYGNIVPEYWYHDISLAYKLPETGPMKTGLVTIGVENLFDKDPPFIFGDGVQKSNTISAQYDFRGRFFFTRLSTSY